MPEYRRAFQPGGTFFITIVTHGRAPIFRDVDARRFLRRSIALARRDRTFTLDAAVLLPDHRHVILTLPDGDADFSTRIAAIKARFTQSWLASGGDEASQSASRARQEYRGVWQKRFWEHVVRDEDDLARCLDYVHFNPVKHGYAACPHEWEWTTFHRLARTKRYAADWCCACGSASSSSSSSIIRPADVAGAEMD